MNMSRPTCEWVVFHTWIYTYMHTCKRVMSHIWRYWYSYIPHIVPQKFPILDEPTFCCIYMGHVPNVNESCPTHEYTHMCIHVHTWYMSHIPHINIPIYLNTTYCAPKVPDPQWTHPLLYIWFTSQMWMSCVPNMNIHICAHQKNTSFPTYKHTYIHTYHALRPKSAQSPMKSPVFKRMSHVPHMCES